MNAVRANMVAYTTRILSDDELDALSARLTEGNFQQTSMMRRLASRHGAAVDVVGVVDADDTPLAGAMLVVTPSRLGHEGSIWQGPLCDPHDRPLMAALTDAIRRRAKAHGAYSVTCWPYSSWMLPGAPSSAIRYPTIGASVLVFSP